MIRHVQDFLAILVLCITTATGLGVGGEASAENLAPLASITGPGTGLQAAVDGVKQQDGSGEWIGGSQNLVVRLDSLPEEPRTEMGHAATDQQGGALRPPNARRTHGSMCSDFQ